MQYKKIVSGIFRRRPNRFIAYVEIGGREEICHVKNTGRCKELLVPGAKVFCSVSDNPARKTKYDLVTVEKNGQLINMDSQAPNIAAGKWLQQGGLGNVEQLRAETVHGASRFDFSFTKDGIPCFLEVKGVTLEYDGVCAFPDAPTVRGTKHLRELTQLAKEGYGAYILFVIQMSGMKYLHPNDATDRAFGAALRDAAAAGVTLLAMECEVTENSMTVTKPVEIRL